MRFRKGKEPVELRRWRSSNPSEPSWEALAPEVKARMRAALSRDQRGVCCYCYGPAEPGSRIEHIEARTEENILAWDNLALACSGGEGLPPHEHHCDKKKGNRTLRVVHPYHRPVLDLTRVSSSGHLKGYGGRPDLREDLDVTLGLNARRPVNARKRAIATAVTGLPTRSWSTRKLTDTLDLLRASSEPIPHQAWVEQWLERMIASR